MATYPASGTIESNFGIPKGLINGVKALEFIIDTDTLASAKYVTGDVFNIAQLASAGQNTVVLAASAEVIEASVGGTAVPCTIGITAALDGTVDTTLATYLTTALNTVGSKSAPFITPTTISGAAYLMLLMGTVTGTVTKNAKIKLRVLVADVL